MADPLDHFSQETSLRKLISELITPHFAHLKQQQKDVKVLKNAMK